MKLKRLMLCVNCDDVFDCGAGRDGKCPSCGSAVVYPLARWTEAADVCRLSEKEVLPHIRRQLMETGAYVVK